MHSYTFHSSRGPRPQHRHPDTLWPPNEYDPVFGGDIVLCGACGRMQFQMEPSPGTRMRGRCIHRECKAWLQLDMAPAALEI
jgi:hypothetical protein